MTGSLNIIGEFGLIRHIKEMFSVPQGVTGIGDDCAVLPQQDGRSTLVSTDMLTEGTHFLMDDIAPYDLGWKSAAVNLSDIAAMGGRPTGTLLALALPAGTDGAWMEQFIRGYRDISAAYGVPLIGGDTTSSPDRLSICVTVLGECITGREVRRDRARSGDLVCVTGTLGDSAAGLRIIQNGLDRGTDDARALLTRHYRPTPRVLEGQAIAGAGASAMMDISDGIGSDLPHILEASGVGARIDTNALPISDALRKYADAQGWDVIVPAIDGGEDYELLFSASKEVCGRIEVPFTVIGEITAGCGIEWSGDTPGRTHSGWHHF